MNIRLSQLKEKFSQKSSYVRVCVRCGAFGRSKVDLLCMYCEAHAKMWQQSDLQVPALLQFPVYALFSWTESSDSVVRPVLYSLKAGRCRWAIENFANEFSWRYSGSKTQPTFFVPQSKTGKPDHAEAWARSLSGVWHAAEPNRLCFSDLNQAGVQKRLTAKERLARSFTQVKNAKSLAKV